MTDDAAKPLDKEALCLFLDQFRAGEALGEASLGAWIAVSTTPEIRGGLRTIQQREGFHARLIEERMRELGATPQFEIPAAVSEALLKGAGDPARSDREKLQEFVQRFPDVGAAIQPICDVADRLEGDPETRSLLRSIAQDERATLEFLHGLCAAATGD